MNPQILAVLIRSALLSSGGGYLVKTLGQSGSDALINWVISSVLIIGPIIWAVIEKQVAASHNAAVQAALNAVSQAVSATTPIIAPDGHIGPVTQKSAQEIAAAAVNQLTSTVFTAIPPIKL